MTLKGTISISCQPNMSVVRYIVFDFAYMEEQLMNPRDPHGYVGTISNYLRSKILIRAQDIAINSRYCDICLEALATVSVQQDTEHIRELITTSDFGVVDVGERMQA